MRQATKREKVKELSWRDLANHRLREGAFILLSSIAIYLLISLLSYSNDDPGWSYSGLHAEILNKAGRTGAFCSDVLFSLFGYIAYLFPVSVVALGYFVFKSGFRYDGGKNPKLWSLRIGGLLITLFAGCGLAALYPTPAWQPVPMSSGGLIGSLIKQGMVTYLNTMGARILLIALFLTGITLFTGFSWVKLADLIGRWTLKGATQFMAQIKLRYQHSLQKVKDFKLPVRFRNKKSQSSTAVSVVNQDKSSEAKSSIQDILNPFAKEAPLEEVDDHPFFPLKQALKKNKNPLSLLRDKKKIDQKKQVKQETPTKQAQELSHALPSLSLLEHESEEHNTGFSSDQLTQLSHLVETRLKEFGVDVKVVGVHPGPVVTRFELDLAAGIKVSKITGLAKDLARSLSVVSVRVVEVIPGKSLVGLEIPNVEREMVRLKEVLADQNYQQSKSPLTLGLGKDISGRSAIADLSKMPHLLVAGTTGSGKSVGLNAMLLSILYKASPEEVRMILIDPKMLELAVYDNIPHLLTPVVTDVKDAANALRWCVAEMESRYQLMAHLGVRNITGYNDRVKRAEAAQKPILDPLWHPRKSEKPEPLAPLPYIVVVVDEFADMIMVVGKKVEELIARLAQKARAAGIHLILATQRPSVDVITGLIKANIPTRIAFQVSSKIDSRTILDQSGAEQLLGHGDMLFLPPGTGICQRIHGAFVSDEEVHNVTEELRKMGQPVYIETVTQSKSNPELGLEDEEYDELYDQAVMVVVETRRASISLVQRKLKIGYNRAARLIEKMESEGLVSEVQSNGSREVLAPPAER